MAKFLLNRRWFLSGTAVAMGWGKNLGVAAAGEKDVRRVARVLLFSGTGWYRHPEIPQCNGWLVRTLGEAGYEVDVTETPGDLTPQRLARYDVFLMNNCNELTTLLNQAQRQAIEDWYKQGRAIVALHAALVHQTKWSWFYALAGCDFDSDSLFEKAKVLVDPAAKDHPTVKGHGSEFWYQADWTNHDKPVTGLPGVTVLLRVDESTYDPVRQYFKERGGKPMGKDHPIAWLREHGGGRFFYTELGHDLRSLDTTFGKQHLVEGVRWAARN
jgi:type 1 glutamine amidotransferase